MFSGHRLEVIKEILQEKRYVDVSYLSDVLSVSEVTIRRDLNKLEEEGFLTRSFGGATLAGAETPEGTGTLRMERSLPERENMELSRLGELAARQILPGDVVFLGDGEECRSIARAMPKTQNATVLTNDLQVAQLLEEHPQICVMLIGGILRPGRQAVFGDFALQNLQGVCIKSCFFAADGMSVEKGYTMKTVEQCSLLRYLNENVEDCYLLVSKKKIGTNSNFVAGALSEFSNLIVSHDIEEGLRMALTENDVRLYTVFD